MTKQKCKLEEIADKLLAHEITAAEAEKLTAGLEITPYKPYKTSLPEGYQLLSSLGRLKLVNREDFVVSTISYLEERDSYNESFIYLESARSFEPSNGYFSLLFRELKKIARKKRASHILLEVDESNITAQEIYEHLGFYFLGYVETCSENIDRIFMRYDL